MDNHKTQPWIILNLPQPIGAREFSSREDFVAWLDSEKKFWLPTVQSMSSIDNYSPKDQFNKLFNALFTEANNLPEDASANEKNELASHFSQAIASGLMISDSFEGRFIKHLNKNYTSRMVGGAAGYIFARRAKHSPQVDDEAAIGQQFGRMFIENAIPSSLVEDLRQQSASVTQDMTDTVRNTESKLEEMSRIYEERKADFDRLKKTYSNQLKLESPANYWTSKKRWHYSSAILIASVAVLVAWVFGDCLMKKHETSLTELEEMIKTAGAQMNWWLIVVYSTKTLIPAIALLWALRILVRLFLSQMHLGTDAAERSVLITTWLAMLKEQGLLEERERWIVLHQVFRHGATGIVKEDLSPYILSKWIDGSLGSDTSKSG